MAVKVLTDPLAIAAELCPHLGPLARRLEAQGIRPCRAELDLKAITLEVFYPSSAGRAFADLARSPIPPLEVGPGRELVCPPCRQALAVAEGSCVGADHL